MQAREVTPKVLYYEINFMESLTLEPAVKPLPFNNNDDDDRN